ncbi:MAG TPA: protein-disulfide reductase DsbD family protein [Rhodospirillales bacterium]|nr:protein-disulfide reductase DsbD family protein [Rhodospirillales bacterium]HJO68386.1 protein-disulfide reductase DsbD family protein [Rhodospirillales bacterium]
MARFRIKRAATLVLALAAVPVQAATPAFATESPWVETDQTAVRLISAAATTGASEVVALGLQFRLKEGWKIYWRTPGDAGFPPQLDFSGSSNLAGARLSWPAPVRFSVLGLETLGYKDEVVLPIAARLDKTGEALAIDTRLRYLTCSDICIPYETRLRLDVPSGTLGPSRHAHLINRFAARVPADGSVYGLTIESAEASGAASQPVLRVSATASEPFERPDLYVEGPPELAFSAPRLGLSEGGRRAHLEVSVYGIEDLDGALPGKRLTLTLVDGARTAERTLSVAAARGFGLEGSLAFVLALAVLGGLILNLMPCVLPVLSIKLMGVIGHGGGERARVRASFLASAAGIEFAFLVLAGALVALRSAGLAVGWGIQFQYPWFLIFMTLVVTLFACNLWGFLALSLPGGLAERLARLGGGADGKAATSSLGGSFLAGAFATLLATPCSAPFLGTAVGFALSRGPADIVAIFAALGLGLALPYLAVAAVPAMATRLPKPGPWMVVLRRLLGVALAATALWLLSVLEAQAGWPAALAAGAAALGVGVILYVRHGAQRRTRAVASAAVIVVAVVAFAVPPYLEDSRAPRAKEVADPRIQALWQPFDEAAIPDVIADGKLVLVDVAADWCITCSVNKALVLHRGRVLERLMDSDVVAMRADWTEPDDAISRYLGSFGRYGIPFDAVYGPGAPRGIALPELLSEDAVLTAFERAQAKSSRAATGAAVSR